MADFKTRVTSIMEMNIIWKMHTAIVPPGLILDYKAFKVRLVFPMLAAAAPWIVSLELRPTSYHMIACAHSLSINKPKVQQLLLIIAIMCSLSVRGFCWRS